MASMAKRRRRENVAEPTPKITWKEIKRQKVLIFWALIIVIYGIIFYYLPLGGWVMAFEDYKPKDGLFTPLLWDLQILNSCFLMRPLSGLSEILWQWV